MEGGRVSPENAREHAIFEKTRTISSFSIVFLRKSANSVAETVQIFGHFPGGKNGPCEITVDLDAVEVRGGRTAATIPPACGRYAQRRLSFPPPMANAGDPITRSTILHFDVRRWAVEATQMPQDELTAPVGYPA